MKLTVENPTHKSKAVRVPGGHEVILPGKKASLDVDMSADDRAKYEKAGLIITEAKAKAASDDAKAKADAEAAEKAKADAEAKAKADADAKAATK